MAAEGVEPEVDRYIQAIDVIFESGVGEGIGSDPILATESASLTELDTPAQGSLSAEVVHAPAPARTGVADTSRYWRQRDRHRRQPVPGATTAA